MSSRSNLSESMQREAAEGDVYRREKAARQAKSDETAAVPASSLPSRAFKSPPMWVQLEAFLASDRAKELSEYSLENVLKLYVGCKKKGY